MLERIAEHPVNCISELLSWNVAAARRGRVIAAGKRTVEPHLRYRLHVERRDVTHVVWRRVWVEGHMSLVQLDHILQAAMGWTDAHLHEFPIGRLHCATPHPDDDPQRELVDERKVKLSHLLEPGLRCECMYDFGDGWLHSIHVEEALPQAEPCGAARVKAGERAC